jgi:hypothetical protein
MDVIWNDSALILLIEGDKYQISNVTIISFLVIFLVFLSIIYFSYKAVLTRIERECKWRRISEKGPSPFTKWQCKACRIEAFSTDNQPPKECKKTLKVVI